jgi:hypothetical protein
MRIITEFDRTEGQRISPLLTRHERHESNDGYDSHPILPPQISLPDTDDLFLLHQHPPVRHHRLQRFYERYDRNVSK